MYIEKIFICDKKWLHDLNPYILYSNTAEVARQTHKYACANYRIAFVKFIRGYNLKK